MYIYTLDDDEHSIFALITAALRTCRRTDLPTTRNPWHPSYLSKHASPRSSTWCDFVGKPFFVSPARVFFAVPVGNGSFLQWSAIVVMLFSPTKRLLFI